MNGTTTLVTLTYGQRLHYLTTLVSRSLGNPRIQRVIIVNNASTDNLRSLCDSWPGQVEVIDLPTNTGSAVGYKVGIEAALASGAEYIWLMDDDNAPKAGAINALHKRLFECAQGKGWDKTAVIGFRPTHQADIAAGVPRPFAVQWRSSCFGFHIAQLPYKVWRRTAWGRPDSSRAKGPLVKLPFTTYGGLLAHRLADTLKTASPEGRVAATLPRADKWLAQTPQMFRIGLLGEALERAGDGVTDEAGAIEAMGLSPLLVAGSARNFKLTYAEDFELAEALLARPRGAPPPPADPFPSPPNP